jgi:hypothetical protein
VTGHACGIYSQVGILFGFKLWIADILLIVTIFASFFGMGYGQGVSCEVVIKLFNIQPDKLKIFPVMFAMAIYTLFTLHLNG